MNRRGIVAVLGLVLGMLAGPVSTQAAEGYDFRVQVGARPPGGETFPFSYTRFYPETLRVHRGQTVLFDTVEPFDLHTVSFWPAEEDTLPSFWRTNEAPERIAINDDWRRSPCGSDTESACTIDGSGEYLRSGLMTGVPLLYGTTWRVALDVPAGTTIPYLCRVHPGMKGSITVVDDIEALPTQAELDAQTHDQVAADTEEAISYRAMLDGQAPHREEDGRNVWEVRVGDASPSGHVSIMTYMPSQLPQIQPGDAVEFVSHGVGHHSVTFPTELVGPKAPGPGSRLSSVAIHPACDLDDDPDGGAPDIPGPWAPFTPVACPGTFELVLSPWLADPHLAPDNLVVTPLTYHDSGLMWSEHAPEIARARPDGSGHFLHSLRAEFPDAGEFAFACTVHGADHMAGTIQVG